MPERILAHDVLDTGARRTRQPEPRPGELDPDGTVIPKWTPEDVPQRTLLPLYAEGRPVVVDNVPRLREIALVRDATADILWFAPTSLTLTDFTLTVRRQVRPDGAVAISGGSAVLSLSVYVDQRQERSARIHADVLRAVEEFLSEHPQPYGLLSREIHNQVIRPTPQYRLAVDLQLPAGVAAAAPMITVSPLAGAATIAAELTEAGVLAWQSALERGDGRTIPGTVRATVSIPTVNPDTGFPGVDTRVVDTALGTLLAERGAADIRQIDPQQAVDGTVVVVGSQLVTAVTVALRPSGGQAPTSAVFGPSGGRTSVTLVTQHPETMSIDWRADVAFTPPRWPVVPASGRLDTAGGWITIIKPESWCVGYVLTFVPVNTAGRPVPASSRARDRVQGVLNFTAPYVAGGLLSTTIEAEYARPTSFVLPRYPDRPFGDLVLTVFANTGDEVGQASRKLGETDVIMTALVYPGGRVELLTPDQPFPGETAADMPPLRRGAEGPAVKRLQQLLNERMPDLAPPLPVIGTFGPRTEERVREFQRRAGIFVDGFVGPQTWGALLGT